MYHNLTACGRNSRRKSKRGWRFDCIFLCALFCPVTTQEPTLQGTATVYARQGDTAVFPWRYTTPPGFTLDTIFWRKIEGSSEAIVMRFRHPDQYDYGPGYDSTKAYSNESAFLLLTDAQQGDIATYRCSVQMLDSMGTLAPLLLNETELIFPTLASAPVVTLPSPLPVVGSTTALSCQSSDPGTPAVTYQWYKGGTIITAVQGRYSFSQDGSTFTITGVQRGDEAMYSCKASNLAGEVSSTQHLMEVYYPPSKPSIQITVASVLQDQQTVLTCRSADYKPDPTYSWKKGTADVTTDGTRLVVDAAAGTLSINQAQSGDMGGYTCTATNVAGPSQPSDVQQLEVRYRSPDGPSVSGFDSDSPPFSGQPNPLQCQITGGNPLPSLGWTRDSVTISQVSTSTSGQTVTSRLTATLTADDNGKTYACTENHVAAPSPPRSSSVVLEVNYAPDAPTVSYDGSAVIAGTTLSVTCATNTGNPTPSISWYKVVPEGVNQPAGTAGQLEFDPISKDSNGDSYICTATNAATEHQGGDPPSTTITITVHYPPTIVSITPDLTVDEFTDVSLSCTADCNPPPTSFTWNYNGAALQTTSSGDFTLNTSLTRITHEWAGTYTCTVANGIPDSSTEVSRDTVITVEFPPKFTHQEVHYTAEDGDTVNLTCSAIAEPAITDMQWIRDGQVLTTGGQFTVTQRSAGVSVLTIADVMEDNYGMYNCTAENAKGLKWSIITLDPQGPPHTPTNLKVVYKNPDGHVTVQWTAGFNGGLETTHTVDYKKLGADDWTSGDTVTQPVSENHKNYNSELQLGSQGNFTIRLITSNSAGDSVPAVTVDVLIEGETILEGRLIVDQDFHTDYNNLDSQRSQNFIDVVVAELNETMRQANLPGYQGSRVTKLSPGSVVTDFETTVATSEVQRAIRAFANQVATGSLGGLSVVEGTLQVQSYGPERDNSLIIIIACVCGSLVLVIAVVGGSIYSYRRRRSDKGNKDTELNERKPKRRGQVPDSANSPTNVEDDTVGPYATSRSEYQSLRISHEQKSDHTYQGLMSHNENKIPDEAAYEDLKISSEFPRSQLDIKEELGQGEFGSVYKAEARNISDIESVTMVAVKTMRDVTSPAASSAFFKELAILKSLGTHPNVVSFLGCCTDAEPFYLLLEYVSGGSLQSTLRTSRTQQTYGNLHGGSKSLSSRDLTRFAWDVAKGMAFLSAKKILHRDLATRNVLVATDRTCKVSDFGFSREGDEYERTTKTRLPIRWMAPESLFHRKYTTKTDVWAFGVLLWEIATLGATPYNGMSKREVMDGVQQGYRMDKPPHCDQELYTLMLSCWNADPARRPDFRRIQRTLESLMETEHDYIHLSSLDENTYQSLQTATDEKY